MSTISTCGNLTRDPVQAFSKNGVAMTNFSVADNISKDKTVFYDCTAFGKQGELILQFFTKGKPIFISGTFDTSEYDGRDGVHRTALRITVNHFQFVSGGGDKPQQTGDSVTSAPAEPMYAEDLDDIKDPFADQ